jgi:ADP-heptose:LPS heptosyltransferase
MEFQNVKKILIFKLCCFGDTVFMTPAIESLKKAFPEAKIYYAYAKWVEPMMKYIPGIGGSILFENVYGKSTFSKLRGAVKFIRCIRKEKFDLVLNGHRSSRLSLILAMCGIRYRLGFKGTSYLTHTADFRSDLGEFLRYEEILSANGVPSQKKLPFLNKPQTNELRLKYGVIPGDKVIGIFPCGGNNPGTQMSIKKWELSRFYKLAELINCRFPEIKIFMFQGKSRNEKLDMPPEVKAEKLIIDNDLLACCDIFISADTGSLHIAAGFDVSTVSIFGPSDPKLLAPVNSENSNARHKYIWKQIECSPCYTPQTAVDKKNPLYWRDDNFICRLGTNECMKFIQIDEVFRAVEEILEYLHPTSIPDREFLN